MTAERTNTKATDETDGLPIGIKILILLAILVVAYILFVDVLGFVSLL